jgi:hypothetical protein
MRLFTKAYRPLTSSEWAEVVIMQVIAVKRRADLRLVRNHIMEMRSKYSPNL